MKNDLHSHYLAVLAEEKATRERLVAELYAVDAVIARLAEKLAALAPAAPKTATATAPAPVPAGTATTTELLPDNLIFAGISVRWAVLKLMADIAKGPMRSVQIADELQARGVRTGGQNFAANVSAVVSEMVHKKLELSVDDGRYQITEHGREMWDSIRQSRQYRSRRGGVKKSVDELLTGGHHAPAESNGRKAAR